MSDSPRKPVTRLSTKLAAENGTIINDNENHSPRTSHSIDAQSPTETNRVGVKQSPSNQQKFSNFNAVGTQPEVLLITATIQKISYMSQSNITKTLFRIYSTIVMIALFCSLALKMFYLIDAVTTTDQRFPKKFQFYSWQLKRDRITSNSDPTWIFTHSLIGYFEAVFCWYSILSGKETLMNYNSKRVDYLKLAPFWAFIGLIFINFWHLGTASTKLAVIVNLVTLVLIIVTRIFKWNRTYFILLTSPIPYEIMLFTKYWLL